MTRRSSGPDSYGIPSKLDGESLTLPALASNSLMQFNLPICSLYPYEDLTVWASMFSYDKEQAYHLPGPSVESPPRVPVFSPGSPEWHITHFSGPQEVLLLWHMPQNFPFLMSTISISSEPERISKPASL